MLDGNGLDTVFDDEKDSILKLTFESTGGISRKWESYSVVPTRTNLSERSWKVSITKTLRARCLFVVNHLLSS